jgi:predicted amidohydrolase
MRVAALELPHVHGQVRAQLERADRLLSQARGVDLALLPECALTGYLTTDGDADLRPFAERLDGPTASLLSALARAHAVTLAAPLVEKDGERFFNSFLVFGPDGKRLAHYRKRHPWYVERWAASGDLGTPVFDVAGAQVTIGICFDVHFLEAEAAPQLAAASVLLFPSAWVDDEPVDARGVQLPALAQKHRLAIVNANWGEGLPRVRGQGTSRILDHEGTELARAAEGLAIAELSIPPGK